MKEDREIREDVRECLHILLQRQLDGISNVFQHWSYKHIYFLIYPLFLSINYMLYIIYFDACISGWE